MNAKQLTWLLAVRSSSPFHTRANLVCVPNVSWAMLPWEADLLVCSKSGYLTEVEVKVTFADWKADLLKQKHREAVKYRNYNLIKYFYYAAPAKLAVRHSEINIPEYAGVVSVCEEKGIRILKFPKPKPGFLKLNNKEIFTLLRLGSIKAWNQAHKEVAAT